MKTRILLPMLLLSAVFVSPASANWFSNPDVNINLNLGSAPNPTPADIREDRLPIVTKDEDNSKTATPAAKTASTDNQRSAPTPSATTSVAAAAPAR